MADATRTVQLRRYRLEPGHSAAFLAWWRDRLVPAREAFGFRVEFAAAVADTDDFVWAVSAEGDAAAFQSLDEAWVGSAERAAAFEGEPRHVRESTLQLADLVA